VDRQQASRPPYTLCSGASGAAGAAETMAKKPSAINFQKESKKKLRVKRKAVGLEKVRA
jgi:hypothetical protein